MTTELTTELTTDGKDRPPPAVARLTAEGVPGEVLSRLCARIGFRLAEDVSAGGVYLVAGMTEERLSPVLARPYHGYVEFREDEAALPDLVRSAAVDGNFSLSMTTPTAFALDVARLVCDALATREALSTLLRSAVEMALHETVANAILHGNLGLESGLKADADHFDGFCDCLAKALQRAEEQPRWIGIVATWTADSLDILVDDQGSGFVAEDDPPAADPPVADPDGDVDRPYGRGLAIIRALATAVTVSRGGRRTALHFCHEDLGRHEG